MWKSSVNIVPAVAHASFGLSVTSALRPPPQSLAVARLLERHLHPGDVRVQQALQVLDVVNGRSQRLHFTEPLVLKLLRQVLSEARVPLVDAAHAVPLALVPLLDERGLEGGVLAHAEGRREGEAGQPPAGEPLAEVGGVDVEGHPQPERILVASGAAVHGDPAESQRRHKDILH